MGSGRWDADSRSAYRSYANSTVGKSTDQIYTARGINENLDPRKIRVRESRDSAHNPESTPVIIALDVTGSMGMLADSIAREGLGKLFTEILDRKPVSDPHLMFMGVGDANFDSAPLQVSQFEADKRIIEQLTQLYIEHGGGGNAFESYNLPWYFARYHTVHDAMMKRHKRGFLFTVGDEEAPHDLTHAQIEQFIGRENAEIDLSTPALLAACEQVYEVFHVVVEQGSHASTHRDRVFQTWNALLGQHVIPMADYTKLPEIIVSALAVAAGQDATNVAGRWSDDRTAEIVHHAIKNLPKPPPPPTTERPVIAL